MKKYFEYLEQLRQSGEINMCGALPYLQREFTELTLDRARANQVLQAWMDSYQTEEGEEK